MPKGVPEGTSVISPMLIVQDPQKELDFLVKGLGAVEKHISRMPDNSIVHGEVRLGNSTIMIGPASPPRSNAMKMTMMHYVVNCEAAYQKALANGAVSKEGPKLQFYGDKTAVVIDPSKNEVPSMQSLSLSPSFFLSFFLSFSSSSNSSHSVHLLSGYYLNEWKRFQWMKWLLVKMRRRRSHKHCSAFLISSGAHSAFHYSQDV